MLGFFSFALVSRKGLVPGKELCAMTVRAKGAGEAATPATVRVEEKGSGGRGERVRVSRMETSSRGY